MGDVFGEKQLLWNNCLNPISAIYYSLASDFLSLNLSFLIQKMLLFAFGVNIILYIKYTAKYLAYLANSSHFTKCAYRHQQSSTKSSSGIKEKRGGDILFIMCIYSRHLLILSSCCNTAIQDICGLSLCCLICETNNNLHGLRKPRNQKPLYSKTHAWRSIPLKAENTFT